MSTRPPGTAIVAAPSLPGTVRMPPGAATARARRRGAHRLAALAGLLACGSLAHAGDCTIGTTPINFGVYDPITTTAPVDSTGTVRVQCSAGDWVEGLFGVDVTIGLSPGNSGTYAARSLRQAPASTLQYNLYTTAARTTVWGNGSAGTGNVGGAVGGLFSGQPNPRSFTVYGRVPAGQDPNLGLHGDTITVTVVF